MTLTLFEQVGDFLNGPVPLWENKLTSSLTLHTWSELHSLNVTGADQYSVASCILKQAGTQVDTVAIAGTTMKIEIPSEELHEFYTAHGLELIPAIGIKNLHADRKIADAFNLLALIKPISVFLQTIIKTVQIIQPQDDETDISYSHPEIPFSIFLSVCADSSLRSTLRVAESILHEAMHLKLTLIENVQPLVEPFDGNVYFSPWRNEKRPARGVLHGLFVFRALLDYFSEIKNYPEIQPEFAYVEKRIRQIKTDLSQLKDFASCDDLTTSGANLTKNLLPSN